MPEHDRFHVLTGGPGSGKSTLLDALEAAGFARSSEAGRGVILEEQASGGTALPWLDPAAFGARMLDWDLASYRQALTTAGPVFFDRGIPDIVGYLRLTGLPVPGDVERAAREMRYNDRVFIAPPWPDIYRQDSERRQDFAEAVRTHDAMVETYTAYGYRLVELPRLPVGERVRFVLETTDLLR